MVAESEFRGAPGGFGCASRGKADAEEVGKGGGDDVRRDPPFECRRASKGVACFAHDEVGGDQLIIARLKSAQNVVGVGRIHLVEQAPEQPDSITSGPEEDRGQVLTATSKAPAGGHRLGATIRIVKSQPAAPAETRRRCQGSLAGRVSSCGPAARATHVAWVLSEAKREDSGVELGNFRRTLSLQSLGQEKL